MSRKKTRVPKVDDYGEHSGIGTNFADLPRRVLRVGVAPGWRDAVADQPGGARLVALAQREGEKAEGFKRALVQWVQARLDRGLPIPPQVPHNHDAA